nr:hypothetical protein [Tanacetum cinerariifolium]
MANENVPALAPTRFDNQILPYAACVPIGKKNFDLDLQRKQKNPIFQISIDILQNINFFIAFVASTSLDEDSFRLDVNLLREALEITLVDQAHRFVSPPSGDAIVDFVNQLGYPGEIYFVSRMRTPKADKPMKPTPAKQAKLATAKQPKPKPVKEKPTKHTPIQKAGKGKVIKARTVKSPFQLVDKPDEEQDQPEAAQGQAHVCGVAIHEHVPEATRLLLVVEGKGKAIATEEQRRTLVTDEASTGPSTQPQDDTSANIVRETPFPIDTEIGTDTEKVISEGDIEIVNIGEEQWMNCLLLHTQLAQVLVPHTEEAQEENLKT